MKKLNNLSNKFLLMRLKKVAIDLRANYQIPYMLCKLIRDLDNNCSMVQINYLKSQCEHLMRVKGYYKKYPSLDKTLNESITYDYIKVRERK